MMRSFRLPRDIEQVDTHKDDCESTKQGNGIDGSGGIEPLKQDGRGDDRGGGEKDVVDWVNDVGRECIEGFIEVVLTISTVHVFI